MKRLLPCSHVLIDAVDERPIEIEYKAYVVTHHGSPPGLHPRWELQHRLCARILTLKSPSDCPSLIPMIDHSLIPVLPPKQDCANWRSTDLQLVRHSAATTSGSGRSMQRAHRQPHASDAGFAHQRVARITRDVNPFPSPCSAGSS